MSRRFVAIISAVVIIFMGGYYMGIWQRLFGKKANPAEPTITSAISPAWSSASSLHSLTFDTSLLTFDREEDGRLGWFTKDGDSVSQYYFAKPPDIPSNLRSVQQVRDFYLSSLKDSPAKLVELDVVTIAGCSGIRFILKAPQQPSGMTYLCSITIPFRDFSYVLKVQCGESGMTGVREAVLFDQQLKAGKVTFDQAGIKGDWNPDDVRYDAEFPQHPLSRLRSVVKRLEASCSIDAETQKQPKFLFPSPEAGQASTTRGVTAAPAPFKMPIDDVFALKVPGSVVVVGVIAEGAVQTGDALWVISDDGTLAVHVQAIETYPAGADRSVQLQRGGKGDRVGIMLSGINKDQIKPHALLAAEPPAPLKASSNTMASGNLTPQKTTTDSGPDAPSGSNWRIEIKSGLKAHFLQPVGPSLPGTDWAVKLHDGVKEQTVLVRAYARDVEGLSAEQETQAVAAFVARLLRDGWTPAQWKGKPGELTYRR